MSATCSNAKCQKKNLRNSEDGSTPNIHSMALKYLRLRGMNCISTHSRQDIKALQCFDPFSHSPTKPSFALRCAAAEPYQYPPPWRSACRHIGRAWPASGVGSEVTTLNWLIEVIYNINVEWVTHTTPLWQIKKWSLEVIYHMEDCSSGVGLELSEQMKPPTSWACCSRLATKWRVGMAYAAQQQKGHERVL